MSRATTFVIVGLVVALLPGSTAVAGTHPQGDRRDRIEDVRDRIEDRLDRREDRRDQREDRRDRREDRRDRRR